MNRPPAAASRPFPIGQCGGPGAIRVVSATDITGVNVSPPPVLLK